MSPCVQSRHQAVSSLPPLGQSKKLRSHSERFLLHKVNMAAYRPNAAIILRNSKGEILVCERSDWRGCWQFPQGGVKKGETLLEALHREVEEELGLRPADYRVLLSKGPYRYLFMNGRKKDGFDGQEQHYFLAEPVDPEPAIRLDGSHEFRAARWLLPASYELAWIGPMKREVYASVFRDFFGI
jgi:putative (di)nucleoside polyphosphate hydrolase